MTSEETDSSLVGSSSGGDEGEASLPMELEGGGGEAELTPRKSKKPDRKRESRALKAISDKWAERDSKKKGKLGLEQFDRLVGSRAWQNRRMAEEQRKERTEGKMSGITVSLPQSFTALQAVAKQQASTVKKLRSHVDLPEDKRLAQSTLKEACALSRSVQRKRKSARDD